MKTLRRPRRLRPPRTERCDGQGREGAAGAAGETGQARAAGFRRDQGRQGVAGYVFHKKLSEVCWEKIYLFSQVSTALRATRVSLDPLAFQDRKETE